MLWQVGPIAVFHLAAVAILAWTEYLGFTQIAGFLLAWGLMNFVWLSVLRRPGVAALMSLAIIVTLIQLSELKYEVLSQSVNFVDVMIIDAAALSFLLTIFPRLSIYILIGVLVAIPVVALVWRLDPFRLPRRKALAGVMVCLAGIGGLSLVSPYEPWENWQPHSVVSIFVRSGADAVSAFVRNGYMESDVTVTDRLKTTAQAACEPAPRRPHIILIHDESAFDIRHASGIAVPPGYGRHFLSFDGRQRDLIVEAAGAPSWYTEYNVFAGLSARSFGRFAFFVTRIAAGRVRRGLPISLRRCGYRTFSLYPAHGAFMGAQSFQASVGVQRFFDRGAMRANDVEPDNFYYDQAVRIFERERARGPMFLMVYLSANHFPWQERWRPELSPDWRDTGNRPDVDEYLRRQTLGMQHYQGFLDQLRRMFPDDRFMLVRYGDHQPDFASAVLEPSVGAAAVVERLRTHDPRYYTTYYAIDAINYRPVNITSALDRIEAAYIPMVILESAGIPLDPSFVEQKQIFERCRGLFYSCAGGAEVRRFNRLLIDAGLITGL
jgi:hypothetical protein